MFLVRQNVDHESAHAPWRTLAKYLLVALIGFALVFGGAPNGSGWPTLLVCTVAAVLLPVSLAAGAADRFAILPAIVRIVAIAIVLLPLLQLVPLPPAIWQALGGRELALEVFSLLGTTNEWRGLSLVPRDTLLGALMLLPPASAFLASLTLDRDGRREIVWALVIFAGITLLVGLIQFGSNGNTLDFYDTSHRGSFLGFFANRNHQGLLMAIAASLAIAAVKDRLRSPHLAMAISALLAIVFLIAAIGTLSRAGIGLSLFSIAATYYVCFSLGRIRWPILIGATVVAGAVLYFFTLSSTVQNALDRFSNIQENARFDIWEKTSPLIEQYFPWGAGLGSFPSVYPVIERLEDVNPLYYNRVHNEYLELLIEFGLPGLIVLLLFVLLIARIAIAGLRGKSDISAFGLPAAVIILLVGLHSTVDYPLRTQTHAVIFALACGFLISSHATGASSASTSISPGRWGDRSVRITAVSLTGQAIAILGFVLFVAYQHGSNALINRSGGDLVSVDEEALPPAQLAALSRALARQPYNQELLNRIYVNQVRNGIDDARRQALVATLGKLGWRHTNTQQNLLVEAVRRDDVESAIDHLDALLRRDRLTEQIIPALMQIEAVPEGTGLVAERLDRDPAWRKDYFLFGGPLANPELLNARLRLFDYMATQNMQVNPVEMRTALFALWNAGRKEEIATIARSQLSEEVQSRLIFDPNFDQWLGVSAEERGAPAPQDWRLTNQPGVSTQIISEDWNSRLVLRWNGRGAPILARTMTFLIEGEKPELKVTVSAGHQLKSLEALRFTLICRGEREVLFARKLANIAEGPGFDRQSAYYVPEREFLCDYPELFIGGKPQLADRGISLSIDSLNLTFE